MGYKNPNDSRRVQKDYEYMNTERGFVMNSITRRFKPSTKNMVAT